MPTFRRAARKLVAQLPGGRTLLLNRWVKAPQPENMRARVIITVLSRDGADAYGKVCAGRFLPPFCEELRKKGIATTFVSNERELSKTLSMPGPNFIVHLYGEDDEQITVNDSLESKAAAVFNSSKIGDYSQTN